MAAAVAVVAIPAARAAEPDLVSALRDKGAQIVPLGTRGGLTGYLVTPVGGAGYSLYVTGDGHGVSALRPGRGAAHRRATRRGRRQPAVTHRLPLAVRGFPLGPLGTAVAPLLPPRHAGRSYRTTRSCTLRLKGYRRYWSGACTAARRSKAPSSTPCGPCSSRFLICRTRPPGNSNDPRDYAHA